MPTGMAPWIAGDPLHDACEFVQTRVLPLFEEARADWAQAAEMAGDPFTVSGASHGQV